jgi:hypothetical protein
MDDNNGLVSYSISFFANELRWTKCSAMKIEHIPNLPTSNQFRHYPESTESIAEYQYLPITHIVVHPIRRTGIPRLHVIRLVYDAA